MTLADGDKKAAQRMAGAASKRRSKQRKTGQGVVERRVSEPQLFLAVGDGAGVFLKVLNKHTKGDCTFGWPRIGIRIAMDTARTALLALPEVKADKGLRRCIRRTKKSTGICRPAYHALYNRLTNMHEDYKAAGLCSCAPPEEDAPM